MKYGKKYGKSDCPKTSKLTGGMTGGKGDYASPNKAKMPKVSEGASKSHSGGGLPAGRGG